LSDEGALRGFASTAGLQPIEVFDVDAPWIYANLPTGLRGLGSSGVAARAIANTSEQEVERAHAAALAPFEQSDGSYRVGATFRCLVARV
jgi:hypothetical protein